MEQVILVDESDLELGTMEKMEAHKKGVLHRAFSILIFNSKGEMLLQKRAGKKYHSAGLWTNACCSHPGPGESMKEATSRKLRQEMGIQAELRFAYKFSYYANLENDLIEHELDHVYIGFHDGAPQSNPDEVEAWRFIGMDALRAEIVAAPHKFTYWFILIMKDLPAYTGSGSVWQANG